MSIHEQLDELMDRKMDRGEFLRMTAITLAGIIGIARFIGALRHGVSTRQGYGAGTYGGDQDQAAYLKRSQE